MTDEEDDQNPEPEYKLFANNLNRIVAILFVLGIYIFIFLKILFIE